MHGIAIKLGGIRKNNDEEDDDILDEFNEEYVAVIDKAFTSIKSLPLQAAGAVDEMKKIQKFIFDELNFIEGHKDYNVEEDDRDVVTIIRNHIEISYAQIERKIQQDGQTVIDNILIYTHSKTRNVNHFNDNGVMEASKQARTMDLRCQKYCRLVFVCIYLFERFTRLDDKRSVSCPVSILHYPYNDTRREKIHGIVRPFL